MRAKLDGVSGPNTSNTPTGIAIGENRIRNGRIAVPEEPILVTITSTGTAGATWKQLTPASDGTVALMTGGLTNEDYGPAFEVNGSTTGVTGASGTGGAHVWLHFRPDTNGAIVPTFQGGLVQLIPVRLSQTSGSLGNKTTASNWVYTVKDITDTTTIATGKSPLVARPNGTLAAATYGVGYFNPDGTGFVLLYAYEIPGTGGC